MKPWASIRRMGLAGALLRRCFDAIKLTLEGGTVTVRMLPEGENERTHGWP